MVADFPVSCVVAQSINAVFWYGNPDVWLLPFNGRWIARHSRKI
ncbi:hypothetical protein SCH4B_0492 [Ruegeria sp. TrichCH4B]|nr:hypothetical protein SCH4B_0492 [Ruegeria sp. TrichCH4B]